MAVQQLYDLPLNELYGYKPKSTAKDDFNEFWDKKITLLPTPQPIFTYYDYPNKNLVVQKVMFTSYQNAKIEAILAYPKTDKPLPVIVNYHGYNWAPEGNLIATCNLALNGFAVFSLMVRGQQGRSENPTLGGGHFLGFMTQGILDKETYYYLGVYLDAVQALNIVKCLDIADIKRISVTGGSQGGGIALAACALSNTPCFCAADMPYLCHFNRAIDFCFDHPYAEFYEFLKRNCSPETEAKMRETLSYFDNMNLAERIQCRVLINTGLVDTITPPSTVFAAYNHINSPKEMVTWRFFGHEFIPKAEEYKLKRLIEEAGL